MEDKIRNFKKIESNVVNEKFSVLKESILKNKRIFIYGEGNKEQLIGLILKNYFIEKEKIVFDLYKKDTIKKLVNLLEKEDLLIIISAGENNLNLELLDNEIKNKKAKIFIIGESTVSNIPIFTDDAENIKSGKYKSINSILDYSFLIELIDRAI